MSADVSRDMFSKDKGYLWGIRQHSKVSIDADANDSRECLYWLIRDLGYFLGADGFFATGFQVVPFAADPTNNFAVSAGYGYYEGHRLYLAQTASRNLRASTSQAMKNLASVVSAVEPQTLSDLRMNLVPHALSGQTMLVYRKNGGLKSYTITDNESTTLTVQIADDMVADGVSIGDYWMVVCSTPTVASRTDLVCLNIFKDQVDSNEDENLLHNLGGGYEADQRWKLRTVVEVVEGVSPSDPEASLPTSYVDFLGNTHFYLALATITRPNGQASVTAGNIADLRASWNQVGDYLLKAGDTMTGNLVMGGHTISGTSGSIDFAGGAINGFARIKATDSFSLENSDGETVVDLTVQDNDLSVMPAPAVLRVENHGVSGTFARVQAHYPAVSDDLTTREFVEEQIASHVHPQYMSLAGMLTAQARLTPANALAAVQAAYARSYLQPNEYIDWEHGLDDDFVWFQVHYMPSTGDFLDAWVDGSAILTVGVIDEDTLRIQNKSTSNVDGDRIRVCAMRTLLNKENNIRDLLISGDLIDTVVVSVS